MQCRAGLSNSSALNTAHCNFMASQFRMNGLTEMQERGSRSSGLGVKLPVELI